ncbi:MAG: DEAD/DEAH box helicase family protein [Chloroflexi bacterium]|nr:DEAD/DEAH box helicase family protein [Chloroflexota bacterium]
MPSERETRKQLIDPRLQADGWRVVPYERWLAGDRTAADAVEEHPTDSGPGDYLLYLDGRPVADVEAKKVEVSPQEVIGQAKRYSRTLSDSPFRFGDARIPFVYSTNGYLIYHADLRSSLFPQREIVRFHTPQALRERLYHDFGAADTWLRAHPITDPDRDYQRAAIAALETGLRNGERRMMVAMATGSGKTRMAISSIYRLMKSGYARRVLFLVDRRALAAQAVSALTAYEPEPGLKFDKTYEVYSQQFRREDLDEVGGSRFDPTILPTEYLTNPDGRHAFVYVSTIQRMRINLFGPPEEWDPEGREDDAPQIDIPIHAFDLIIADECHRGYSASEDSKWREVLSHFDATTIGLTATPALHTAAYFGRPIYEYGYQRAVAEGYLVDYDPVIIHSEITMHGHFLQEGEEVALRDTTTGQMRFEQMEDERQLPAESLERDWTAPDRDRKIVDEVAGFLEGQEAQIKRFPKTLVFADNDLLHRSHADQLVALLRERLHRGDDFVQKITGSPSVDRPLQRIRQFRNRPEPGVVVTVDLLSTGVDIPWLEAIVFLRRIQSRILFEQMLGRGTRRCDAIHKTHFTVFDAVGVLEYFRSASEFTFEPPTKPTRTVAEIIQSIADNQDRAYNVRVLVKRLQRIDKSITAEGRLQFRPFVPDGDIGAFARSLADRLEGDWAGTIRVLRDPRFQDLMVTYPRPKPVFIIAEAAQDTVTSEEAFRTADGRLLKPDEYLAAFHRFVRENLEQIEALRILHERPRDWGTEALDELRRSLARQPEGFNVADLRRAYHHALADIISMVHHADHGDPLMSAEERVDGALGHLLGERKLTEPQHKWLGLIRRHLIANLAIAREDFELIEFEQAGATWNRVNKDFGNALPELLQSLNEAVAS